ncbi:BfmA/BtgA family mobilization protein [Formosa sp. PL04]|uniref:BfmA/BtgA family mobilization protein n=1 Tax=Formosa sp. PL04 TaxID=3081755 RepID=UPI002982293B|nr:BfmA/BtgA family mobilization protein [Formosa sp. PL04]MDW5287204.1 BfmA/BtgA family mobilization protein [Formosa sp. PL04]
MDKKLKNEGFTTLKIKDEVAKRFRRFSKKMTLSQSMTLLYMIDFFEKNGLSPLESIDPKIQTLENVFKKRINGMIAILKNIEKHQTKPTVAMLGALFEQAEASRKPIMEQKVRFEEKLKRNEN